MAFLVTVLIDGPTHDLIFPRRWLVAAIIILSRGLVCIDPSGRSGALRPRAAGAAIATIPIVPTPQMVLVRSPQGLSSLGMMRKHGLCLLEAEQKGALVPGVILGRFRGGEVALGQQASISRTYKRRFRTALASAGIAFLMT